MEQELADALREAYEAGKAAARPFEQERRGRRAESAPVPPAEPSRVYEGWHH